MNSISMRTMNIHLPRLIMEEFENLRPNQIFWSDCLKERPSGEKVLLRHEQPQIDVNVVDGAGMVQMNAPKTVTTFREYNKVEIGDKVNSLIACGQQLDVYEKGSCKTETWEGHGKKMVWGPPSRKTQLFIENLQRCWNPMITKLSSLNLQLTHCLEYSKINKMSCW